MRAKTSRQKAGGSTNRRGSAYRRHLAAVLGLAFASPHAVVGAREFDRSAAGVKCSACAPEGVAYEVAPCQAGAEVLHEVLAVLAMSGARRICLLTAWRVVGAASNRGETLNANFNGIQQIRESLIRAP